MTQQLEPEAIVAEIYPKRRLFRPLQWGFRFITANHQKLGHDYDEPRSAEHAIRIIIKNQRPVYIRTVNLDGTTTEPVRIR